MNVHDQRREIGVLMDELDVTELPPTCGQGSWDLANPVHLETLKNLLTAVKRRQMIDEANDNGRAVLTEQLVNLREAGSLQSQQIHVGYWHQPQPTNRWWQRQGDRRWHTYRRDDVHVAQLDNTRYWLALQSETNELGIYTGPLDRAFAHLYMWVRQTADNEVELVRYSPRRWQGRPEATHVVLANLRVLNQTPSAWRT